ncbi:MAG: FAD:protein FMN transferase [Pseudomonadales bacterium]|nr:FAD:protein FMN transferase [Pseudomonadales bacterium]MCP5346031.1 FAD:protein FMN transferase [Pseudomonadales bacterium]
MIGFLRSYGISLGLVAAVVVFTLLFTGRDQEILVLSGYTMGTSYRLQVVERPGSLDGNRIQQDIGSLLNRLDRQVFSTYAEQSELSRFNRASIDQPVRVSRELLEVVMLAREVSDLTDGAFDVTVGPLVNLWGFGPDASRDRVPSDQQIEAARAQVGYQHLQVNPEQSSLLRDADIYVDLSGIAKGYVVDQVALYLDSIGVQSYFLEIGGELKIKGLKPGGQYWVPAVERPEDTAPQVYEILNSQGEELAIAGSGDYRNYFEEDGVRYSHEIDPRTGRPIAHRLAAVYVIDSQTARADALATALMVLGYQAGMALAESESLAVYFIVRTENDFTAHYTEQFGRYIQHEGGN